MASNTYDRDLAKRAAGKAAVYSSIIGGLYVWFAFVFFIAKINVPSAVLGAGISLFVTALWTVAVVLRSPIRDFFPASASNLSLEQQRPDRAFMRWMQLYSEIPPEQRTGLIRIVKEAIKLTGTISVPCRGDDCDNQ